MTTQPGSERTTTVKDVQQLSTFAAITSLSYVFWICGGMEMVERLAFYGVRSLAGLYGTDAVKNGGLGLVGAEIGFILSIWYFVQGLIPVFTGGIADRYGYKETIFASTVLKIIGYLLMAWFPSFWGFFAGAIVLAIGTGIFKPGIQGTIANATDRTNSSVAWGIFYQTVNIGGFIGPVMAGFLRQLAWSHVFYACAAVIAINFLLLLTYKEPNKDDRLERQKAIKAGTHQQESLLVASIREFIRPEVVWYMVLFTGFWFMLLIFWDLGPLYIRDWVDTSVFVKDIWGDGTPGGFASKFFVLSHDGTRVMPEGIININSLLIMIFCFLVAGYSAKLKAANSMALGTLMAALALLILAGTNGLWIILVGVVVFSFGEMLSSPKSLEFLANIAPDDKKAMYLGYANLPFAIGALIEGMVGQYFYGEYSAKDTVSRDALVEAGMSAEDAANVPVGEAFERLVAFTGRGETELTDMLYASHNIGSVFYIFAALGILSAFGLYIYGVWTYRRASKAA